MARLQKQFRRWALILGLPAVGYLLLVILTPLCGRVVGTANQQPPVCVTHLPGGWAPENADVIRRLAKLHFDNRPRLRQQYWPEPTIIEERTNSWVVGFSPKTPIYQFIGYRHAVRQSDRLMYFTIDKADFRTRFGIWY